jgi:hypothetical protein
VDGCNQSYFRKYQLLKHGESLKHRDLPAGLFTLLLSDMPSPDLTINDRIPNQDQPIKTANADIDHLGLPDLLNSDIDIDFLQIDTNYQIQDG